MVTADPGAQTDAPYTDPLLGDVFGMAGNIATVSIQVPTDSAAFALGGAGLPLPLPPPVSGLFHLNSLSNPPDLYCERFSTTETDCHDPFGHFITPHEYRISYCVRACGQFPTATDGVIIMHMGVNAGTFTAWCIHINAGVYDPTGNCGAQFNGSVNWLDGTIGIGAGPNKGWYAVQAD